jgi:molybdopterin converting factor small subunit
MSTGIKVLIPAALRPQAGNQEQLTLAGATVGETLGNLAAQYPDLGKRLFHGEAAAGKLNRFVNFYVNDEDIRFMDNTDTPLKPGDELSIVPAIAGG